MSGSVGLPFGSGPKRTPQQGRHTGQEPGSGVEAQPVPFPGLFVQGSFGVFAAYSRRFCGHYLVI
jgi:hypothetical protein